MERLGFATFIVFVPGHAFVGWIHNAAEEEFEDAAMFVETTMIGNNQWTFLEAVLEGISKYFDNAEKGYFDSGEAVVIPIPELRQFGIMPNNIP